MGCLVFIMFIIWMFILAKYGIDDVPYTPYCKQWSIRCSNQETWHIIGGDHQLNLFGWLWIIGSIVLYLYLCYITYWKKK